jgi:hypothetical protein
MLKKQLGNFVFFMIILLVLLVAGAFFMNLKIGKRGGEIGACTMDAKQCPDGSYVGRIPPDCEFTPCP